MELHNVPGKPQINSLVYYFNYTSGQQTCLGEIPRYEYFAPKK